MDGRPKRKKTVTFKNVCAWTEGQNGRIWLRLKFFYTCGRRAKTEENSYIQKRMRVDGRPKRKDMVTFENLYVWTGGPKRKKIVTFKNVCVWTGSQKGRKWLRLKKTMCGPEGKVTLTLKTCTCGRKAKTERKGYV